MWFACVNGNFRRDLLISTVDPLQNDPLLNAIAILPLLLSVYLRVLYFYLLLHIINSKFPIGFHGVWYLSLLGGKILCLGKGSYQ